VPTRHDTTSRQSRRRRRLGSTGAADKFASAPQRFGLSVNFGGDYTSILYAIVRYAERSTLIILRAPWSR